MATQIDGQLTAIPLASISLPTEERTRALDEAASVITSSVCEDFSPNTRCARHEMTSFAFEVWNASIAFETRRDALPPQYIPFERGSSQAWKRIAPLFDDDVVLITACARHTPCCRVKRASTLVRPVMNFADGEWTQAFPDAELDDLLRFTPQTTQPHGQLADTETFATNGARIRIYYEDESATHAVLEVDGRFYRNRIGVPIAFSPSGPRFPNLALPFAHSQRARSILRYIDRQTFQMVDVGSNFRRCIQTKRLEDVRAFRRGLFEAHLDANDLLEAFACGLGARLSASDRLRSLLANDCDQVLRDMALTFARDLVRVHMLREILDAAERRFSDPKATYCGKHCILHTSSTGHPVIVGEPKDTLPWRAVDVIRSPFGSDGGTLRLVRPGRPFYFPTDDAWEDVTFEVVYPRNMRVAYDRERETCTLGRHVELTRVAVQTFSVEKTSSKGGGGTLACRVTGKVCLFRAAKENGFVFEAKGELTEATLDFLRDALNTAMSIGQLTGSSATCGLSVDEAIPKVAFVRLDDERGLQQIIDDEAVVLCSNCYNIEYHISKRRSDRSWVGMCNVFVSSDDDRELFVKEAFAPLCNAFDRSALRKTSAPTTSDFDDWVLKLADELREDTRGHLDRFLQSTPIRKPTKASSSILVDLMRCIIDECAAADDIEAMIDDELLRSIFYNGERRVFADGKASKNFSDVDKYDKRLIAMLLADVDDNRRIVDVIGHTIPFAWDAESGRFHNARFLLSNASETIHAALRRFVS